MRSSFKLTPEQRAEAERIVASNGREPDESQPTSWAPVDLGPALAGDQMEPPPSMLRRSDGIGLLYPGRIHTGAGEPESCKSLLAGAACTEVLADGGTGLYLDFEESAEGIVSKLRALGCPDEAIRERFTYVHPDEPLTHPAARTDFEALLAKEPDVVVVDGATEGLTIHGLDLGDNTDIAKWLELVARPAARTGAAVLLIDHVVKDREARGRYPIGGQHKLAGSDVSYKLEVVEPFGRGRDGLVKVSVTKDRPGRVREHAQDGRIADMHLSSDAETGRVTIELRPPDAPAVFRPTVLMGRISEAVAAEPGISTNGIQRDVKGKAATLREALRLLIAEGYIEPRKEGGARCHFSVRPFPDEPNRVPTSQVRPNRVPTHPEPNRVPSSLPSRGRRDGGRAERDTPAGQPRPSHDHCTCTRPARSPRAEGSDLCRTCKRPLAPLEIVA